MKLETRSGSPPVTPAERERLEAAMRLIAASVARRPRAKDLAKAAGMGLSQFHRRFRVCFGETPMRVADRVRIEEAKRRMLTAEPLAAVAAAVGFVSQSHFTWRFRELTGTTPAAWLRSRTGGAGPF